VRFRFVHAADLHLDTPFEGVRRVEPLVADALRDASLQAFDALVSLAIARDAAFVILAGGLYDGPRRGIRAQLAFRRGLERLSRAGIPALLADDPPEGRWAAVGTWPDRVTLLGPGGTAVQRDSQTIATIHGGGGQPDPDGGLAIGVLHGDLDIPAGGGMDYWALGGRHAQQILAEGDPWIVYPGTLQGRGPGVDERGAKGAFVVEVDGRSIAPPEFVPLDRVRTSVMDADITGLGDLGEVAAVLGELAEREVAAADRRSLVLRARLVGAGPVVQRLRRPGALGELLGELRDTRGSTPEFVWWDALEDATRMPLDLDALRRRGDFGSALLELADELTGADSDHLEAFAQRHLASADLPGGAGQVGPERLRRAADLALDTLVLDDQG
jgi:hypothetical protein